MVIINKGKVVAEDTPENLTARLQGAASVYVEIDSQGVDAQSLLTAVPGVTAVAVAARHGVSTGFEVQSERGLDVRRHVAQAVVGAGYGLVELRPMRMSLEEIFLQLTTTDSPAEEVARA